MLYSCKYFDNGENNCGSKSMIEREEEDDNVSNLGVFSRKWFKRPWFDPGEATSLSILAHRVFLKKL